MRTRIISQMTAGLLVIGMSGLLRSQPLLALPVGQIQPNSSQNEGPSYQGSWTGTFRTVGSQGQIVVFIDPSGNLYGSLESDDGGNFAQISGHHCGDTFRMVFTPPPSGINQFGTTEPYILDATATWERGLSHFSISAPTGTGHSQLYTFGRLSNR